MDQKDKKYIETTFGRYFQIVKEEFISQIRPIAEMQKHQGEKIDAQSRKIDAQSKKIDALFEMVAKNSEDIELIRIKLTKIEADIAEIKEELKNKADLDKVEKLEKDILILKRKIA